MDTEAALVQRPSSQRVSFEDEQLLLERGAHQCEELDPGVAGNPGTGGSDVDNSSTKLDAAEEGDVAYDVNRRHVDFLLQVS